MSGQGPDPEKQTRQYVYGVTTASGSAINSNDLLAATEYPDATTGEPSSNSEETYTYNALGQVARMTDRNGPPKGTSAKPRWRHRRTSRGNDHGEFGCR